MNIQQRFLPVLTGIVLFCGLYQPVYSHPSSDTVAYPPQVRLVASNGFKSFVMGRQQEIEFAVNELPSNTSRVYFGFVDEGGNPVGSSHIVTGTSLETVTWTANINSDTLPLSTQFHMEIQWEGDSLAIYNIPLGNLPDTLSLAATIGLGPFISNQYPLNDSLWNPVGPQTNNITLKNLPPRTTRVMFYFLASDTTIVDSAEVTPNPMVNYLDTATLDDVPMADFPLSVRYILPVAYCEGGPTGGVFTRRNLTLLPQESRLFCTIHDTTYIDSIPLFQEQPKGGQVVVVDSVKHGEITNPGRGWRQIAGIYSLNYLYDDYTIEAWVHPDTSMINSISTGEMNFLSADSAWNIALVKSTGALKLVYSVFNNGKKDIYSASLQESTLLNGEWHHIAFVNQVTGGDFTSFYLDGGQILTQRNEANHNYVSGQYNASDWILHAHPFLFGGCNVVADGDSRISDDFTLIDQMDEIKIWNINLANWQIINTLHNYQLQEGNLIGYWNFDDNNCRLNFFDDLSYQNNRGLFRVGATLSTGNPAHEVDDLLYLVSSNTLTDSVRFSFLDQYNHVIDSVTITAPGGKASLFYNFASLPYGISLLRTHEYYPGERDTGYIREFTLRNIPAVPIASARNGWGMYFTCSSAPPANIADSGCLYNAVTISGLPENTQKVTVGLTDVSDTAYSVYSVTYYRNSNPYHHSLSLDGKTNYITTSSKSNLDIVFTLMFWFKTTSTDGGVLAQFSSDTTMSLTDKLNHVIAMKKNGSLSYMVESQHATNILHATGQYNDGAWHHFAAVISPTINGFNKASLYIDGTVVDRQEFSLPESMEGYWMFGRSRGQVYPMDLDPVAPFLQGSFSEISIWNESLDYKRINQAMYLPSLDTCPNVEHYYKLDEGSGTLVKDSKGNLDATLRGGPQKWFVDQDLNTVTWFHDLTHVGGTPFTLIAQTWNPGNDTGYNYELGRFAFLWPTNGQENYLFTYNFEDGLGYFNLGDLLTTPVHVKFNDPNPNPYNNYIFILEFYGPDGDLLKWFSDTAYNSTTLTTSFSLDLGDVPMGSFLYMSVLDINEQYLLTCVNYPILIRPFAPPKVHGDFGPFIQAIAPGTMKAINTFIINTAEIPALTKITAKFVNSKGIPIEEQIAIKDSAETYHITYDMASLSPPVSGMFLEYYLGNYPEPVLEQGPFDIIITRTRPFWFDFCNPSDFSDIEEDSINKKVTFTIKSPLQDPSSFLNDVSIVLPDGVPLLNGSHGTLFSPAMEVTLHFWIDSLKLAHPIDHAKLDQFILNIGAGKSKVLSADFQKNDYENYWLDEDDNLFAIQNFSLSGGISTEFKSIQEMGEEIKDIIDIAGAMDPESAIISPSFSISYSGAFQYSSRLHLKLDTINGQTQWGSYGNLKTNANEGTPENDSSASYHFYGGSFGVEFEIGAKLLEGLVEGDFCVDLKFNAGFGHSYITLPKNDTRFLKDFSMDIHGKVVVKECWGLSSQTVWGPKLFYSHRFWGDDMDDCFPEDDKMSPDENGGSLNENALAGEIIPVSDFVKTPLAYPQASITPSANYNLFTWLEKGDSVGVRHLRSRFLKNKTKKFSDRLTIHTNSHAMNSPVTSGFSDSTVLLAWSQSRYDGLELTQLRAENPIRVFAESQDIWFAVFDITTDSIIQLTRINDDITGFTTGRAEAKPSLAVLSETQALLVWQVADLDNHTSDLWYATLTKSSDIWNSSVPAQITEIDGIETSLFLAKTDENKAVLTCLSNQSQNNSTNRILSLPFDGNQPENQWGPLDVLFQNNSTNVNFLDMKFSGNYGGVIFSSYVTDTNINYESISLIPWDAGAGTWMNSPVQLLVDSIHHFQYPQISINEDGKTMVAVKLEKFMIKTADQRISQIDLLSGDLSQPTGPWYHITANSFVCDTTKQVSELSLSYIGEDTLMLLSQEYVMLPTNTLYYPINGTTWGIPYMNQVLRCFSVVSDSVIDDVAEGDYNVGIEEPIQEEPGAILFQNYPNPCTTESTIGFNLPEQTHILIDLYDMKGYHVARLADQTLGPGTYTIHINTSLLSPGTYIYTLTTDNSILTRRMVVIR